MLATVEGGRHDEKLKDFHQICDKNPGRRENGVRVGEIIHVTETHSDDTKNAVQKEQIKDLGLKYIFKSCTTWKMLYITRVNMLLNSFPYRRDVFK